MANASIISTHFYTLEETAKLLGVKEQTVSNYLRNGELSGKKMGPRKKWHVQGKDILRKKKEWNMVDS